MYSMSHPLKMYYLYVGISEINEKLQQVFLN